VLNKLTANQLTGMPEKIKQNLCRQNVNYLTLIVASKTKFIFINNKNLIEIKYEKIIALYHRNG
jgi:hypothetical protein